MVRVDSFPAIEDSSESSQAVKLEDINSIADFDIISDSDNVSDDSGTQEDATEGAGADEEDNDWEDNNTDQEGIDVATGLGDDISTNGSEGDLKEATGTGAYIFLSMENSPNKITQVVNVPVARREAIIVGRAPTIYMIPSCRIGVICV